MINKRQREFIVTGFAFAIFLLIISYNLTNASLWYDETIEYWYSRSFVGTVPWQDGTFSIYDRIVSTFQPPLFNILFFFWLKISEAEWWMRLFGVIMGLFGAIGVYKTILFGSGSRYKASIAIIIYGTIYQLTYFWQEVSEYALMLALLSWTIYYFLQVLDKPNVKNILLFVIFCVASAYSQYGAVFVIVALIIVAFIKIVFDKSKKNLAIISGSYVGAAVFAALPLYFFFLKPQMENQGTAQVEILQSFSIKSFWNELVSVFEWNFLKDIGQTGHYIIQLIIILFVIAAILYIIKGEKLWMKYLLIANMICYAVYYIAVYLGFYANTSYFDQFANRYNLFLIPIWFVTALLLIYLFLKELTTKLSEFKYGQPCTSMMIGVVTAVLFCWSYLGWASLSNNWSKEDIRAVTEKWINVMGYDTDTIVYRNASSGFSYYALHSKQYDDSILQNVVFQEKESEDVSEPDEEWINNVYDEWPSSLYIVASHVNTSGGSLDDLIDTFTNEGYTSTNVLYSDGASLIYLEKE